MKTQSNMTRLAVIAIGLIAPPAMAYGLNPLKPETGLGFFSVVLIETAAFAIGATMLRPRLRNTVLAALLYFPSMFIVLFWIGYRAGYYDLP